MLGEMRGRQLLGRQLPGPEGAQLRHHLEEHIFSLRTFQFKNILW